jgi:hypothetical protein
VYLFDQDGPGKHIKLITGGSTAPLAHAADALTYKPSRFTVHDWHGCNILFPAFCYLEAAFTSPSSKEGPPLRLPVFINAGAFPFTGHEVNPAPRDVVDTHGHRWMADNVYLPAPSGYRLPRVGNRYATSHGGTGNLKSIYGTVAEAAGVDLAPSYWPMQYIVDVPNGLYHVDMHFIETFTAGWPYSLPGVTPGIGSRVFTVKAGSLPMLTNLDVFKEAGGRSIPLVKSFETVVTGNQLILEFSRLGMISGIAVCLPVQVVAGQC